MKKWSEWFGAMAQRREQARSSPDFGDMGTAFGLDASMEADAAQSLSRQAHAAPVEQPVEPSPHPRIRP
jgi:hypothetical protein